MYNLKLYIYIAIAILSLLELNGCYGDMDKYVKRKKYIVEIAQKNRLKSHKYRTNYFKKILSFEDCSFCKDRVSIYIEGDGLAWKTFSIPSKNPTPVNPIGFKLMLKDNSQCKIYIARPCQYVEDNKCEVKYWTDSRYSPEVISSYMEILDKIKNKLHIKYFILYGYSGGGTIATILSSQRNDIIKLVTIAGNLDIKFWTKKNHLTPLKGSLNPADFSFKLKEIDQIHLIGEKDHIIDKSIFYSYKKTFTDESKIKGIIYKNFTHSCCWEKNWKHILKEINNEEK